MRLPKLNDWPHAARARVSFGGLTEGPSCLQQKNRPACGSVVKALGPNKSKVLNTPFMYEGAYGNGDKCVQMITD